MKNRAKNRPTAPIIEIITPVPTSFVLIAMAKPEKKKTVANNEIIVQAAVLP